jgi:hypothetical protein
MNFIKTYPNLFPEDFCQHVVDNFNCVHEKRLTLSRQKTDNVLPTEKNDFQYFLMPSTPFPKFNDRHTLEVFWEYLQKGFDMYSEEYSMLKQVEIASNEVKLQRTDRGGGYHIWHSEQGNGPQQSNRALVFLVYLNTLPDEACGETEFLYQGLRVKPEAGTAVFWPAAFTHPHRGNAVYGDHSKYVATGWFYCV